MRSTVTLLSLVFVSFAFAGPTRKPVQIVIPQEVLATLTAEQKSDLERIKSILEERLYTWTDLQIELPDSAFADGTQIVSLSDIVRPPQNDEIEQIGAERRELNDEQLKQLQETAIFKVPSAKYPGQFYAWKVHTIFQKGRRNIQISWKKHTSNALDEIVVEIPNRLLGDQPLSVRRGVRNINNGISEIIGLFVGLSEKGPLYDELTILDKIEQEQLAFISANANGRNSRFKDQELNQKVNAVVASIENAVNELWKRNSETLTAKLAVQLRDAGTPEDKFYQVLADKLADAQQEILYKSLLSSAKLENLSPGVAQHLVNQGRAVQIIRAAEQKFYGEVSAQAEVLAAQIKKQHSIRSRSESWLANAVEDAQSAYYKEHVWGIYSGIVEQLKSKGLTVEAQALEQDINFIKTNGATLFAQMSAEEGPSAAEQFDVQIWRKSKWEITKDPETQKFSVSKVRNVVVDTSNPGWRLKLLAARTGYMLKNGLYHTLVTNLMNGPVGLKSFGKLQPFVYQWTVNRDSGVLEQRGVRGQTLASRVSAARRAGDRQIEQFNSQSYFGFFGKTFERALLWFKADLGMKMLVPAGIVVGQTAATATNVVVSSAVTATSLVWAPAAALFRYGFDAAIYDSMATNRTRRGFYRRLAGGGLPLVRSVVVSGLGAAEVAGSAIGATVVHPVAAVGTFGFAAFQKSARNAWDNMWLLAIEKMAKVPGGDTWNIKQVSGPGLSENYFFMLKPNVVLSSVLADLERQDLEFLGQKIKALIKQPSVDAQAALAPFRAVLTQIDLDSRSGAGAIIAESSQKDLKRLEEATKASLSNNMKLLSLPGGVRGHIKLADVDLRNTLAKATQVTAAFYQGRIFPRMNEVEIEGFWKQQNLQRDDWQALATKSLQNIFGTQIGESLESSRATFVIEVRNADLETYLEGVLNANFPEDMQVVGTNTASYQTGRMVRANYRAVSGSEMCSALLLAPSTVAPALRN